MIYFKKKFSVHIKANLHKQNLPCTSAISPSPCLLKILVLCKNQVYPENVLYISTTTRPLCVLKIYYRRNQLYTIEIISDFITIRMETVFHLYKNYYNTNFLSRNSRLFESIFTNNEQNESCDWHFPNNNTFKYYCVKSYTQNICIAKTLLLLFLLQHTI